MSLKRITGVREEKTHRSPHYETRTYKRYRFATGTSADAPRTSPSLSQTKYYKLRKLQVSKPVSLGTIRGGKQRGAILWWYKDHFYVEDAMEAHALGQVRKKLVAGLTGVAPVDEERDSGSFPRYEKHYQFAIGTSDDAPRTQPWLSQKDYAHAKTLQRSKPVSVGTIKGGRHHNKTLWWYHDEFHVEDHSPGAKNYKNTTGLREAPPITVVAEPFDKEVLCYEEWYFFTIAAGRDVVRTAPSLCKKEYREARNLQSSKPVLVGTVEVGRHHDKAMWWYQDEFYVENDGYSSEQVQLLLWEREQKKKRKFDRLRKEMLSEVAIEEARRERIPEDVRIFVWKRDDGRCVQCGSQENLEFDHIIPVSKGGSNTARNIQLLCETCNRRKSGST